MATASVRKDGKELAGQTIAIEFVWSDNVFGPHIVLCVNSLRIRVALSIRECHECSEWIKHVVRNNT